jgi:hypothetical protein
MPNDKKGIKIISADIKVAFLLLNFLSRIFNINRIPSIIPKINTAMNTDNAIINISRTSRIIPGISMVMNTNNITTNIKKPTRNPPVYAI